RFAHSRIPEAEATILPGLAPPAWVYLTAPLDPISSTAIRQMKAAS
ncbi:MAG TPA: nicotinate-nucleotide adenylyltransferase, partial [Hyphomonas atlantica]|nr:nicotinate-nucleotide adenylyltransferase [Hyphomonas atlantica]